MSKTLSPTRDKQFDVTVRVTGHPDYTVRVAALDEWKARTRSMVTYPHKVRGATVEYDVKE